MKITKCEQKLYNIINFIRTQFPETVSWEKGQWPRSHWPESMVYTSTYLHILVHTSSYIVCTGTYWYVLECTCMYCHVRDTMCDVQAHSIQSAGCVRLDINLFKPTGSRLEFPLDALAPKLPLSVVHHGSFPPNRLEYVYRISHPVLRWLPTKLDGTNVLKFHFIDLLDYFIRSVQDPTLKGKLYHDFEMNQDEDGNRVFSEFEFRPSISVVLLS
jgi:hypothetical protein